MGNILSQRSASLPDSVSCVLGAWPLSLGVCYYSGTEQACQATQSVLGVGRVERGLLLLRLGGGSSGHRVGAPGENPCSEDVREWEWSWEKVNFSVFNFFKD